MEQNELLNTLMGMLGEHPEETIHQALEALGVQNTDAASENGAKPSASDRPASVPSNQSASVPSNQSASVPSNQSASVPFEPPTAPKETDAVLSLLSQFGKKGVSGQSDRTRLLVALKPFLNSGRQQKVEQATKLLRLLELAELSGQLGIFKDFL